MRPHERGLGIRIVQQLGFGPSQERQAHCRFVSVAKFLKDDAGARGEHGSIFEEIQFQVDPRSLQVTQTNPKGIAARLVFTPALLEGLQRGGVVASQDLHLGDATVHDVHPGGQVMLFAMLFGRRPCLDGFVETVHVGQDMCASNARRSSGNRVVTAGYGEIVVGKRLAVSVQPIVEIA